ncbi:MAG: beta-phosphoglucomutase family hydrolase [Bacteroidales bacterium]|nr:beta-phosphoglucomutase family hydrolase [Bacteroidales bacterium]
MINLMEYRAVIFDMDGVIVDNQNYHLSSWEMFCAKYNFDCNINTFSAQYFGKSNHEILTSLSGKALTPQETYKLGEEKEEIYRQLYRDEIKPLAGLIDLLKLLKANRIPTAIASSAPTSNVDFVVDSLKIREYFDVIVDVSMVRNAKPDPEIYLKAAERLNVEPSGCLVFEDSHSGIKAALNAGMQVIGLATTHRKEELEPSIPKAYSFEELLQEKI